MNGYVTIAMKIFEGTMTSTIQIEVEIVHQIDLLGIISNLNNNKTL